MTTPTTTWRIPRAAWIMVGLAVSAEATSNALRAYDLGSHLERLTVHIYGISLSLAGIVLVLAAIAVSLSQTRAAWVALTPGDTRQRIVAGIAACLLLSISITAMASHILSAQRAKVGDETKDRNGYHDTKKLYDDGVAELEKVRDAGTVAEAQAALDLSKTRVDDNIWRRTNGCTDATVKASKAECKAYRDQKPTLEADLAKATRKAELEAKLPDLKADLDRQHLTDEATASETTVSWGWAWIMGLGVVMIATFGPAIFAKVETVIVDDVGQSDFMPIAARSTDVVRDLFRPDDQKPGDGSSKRGPDSPQRPSDGLSKAQALDDLMQRLSDGQTIPSQQTLADDWNRPKQTVHEWMKGWRRIGIIPPATPAGRCKATAPA